jgi:hypothetical protein
MKKLLLTLLISLMLAGSAWAVWVKVAESDRFYRYIDPATIRKDGNLVRLWEINEAKQRDEKGALSHRSRTEYDCKQERRRVLSLSSHSGSMAGGTILFEDTKVFWWEDIPPDTVAEILLKIVCAK